MKTVAIYTRVSTQEQSQDGYSLGEQESRLRKYADAHGWAVASVYSDPGYSGAKLDRPAIQKLMRDAPQHLFDAVIVYKLDRLSRSQKDTLYLIEDVFNANNIGLISMMENFDTQTPFGKAMIGILSVFAQLERDQITERMNMGRLGRAKAGYFSGSSRPPIGYTYTRAAAGERNTLEVDPYGAEQIRKIYDLFLHGDGTGKEYTLKGIARYMHEHYKNPYGDWSAASSISRILHDRVYIGEVSFSGKWYPGIHVPIIDREDFEEVQRKYDLYMSGNVSGFSANFKGASLLTGLVRCGLCGDRFFVRSWNKHYKNGTESHVRKYSCYTASGQRIRGVKACSNVSFNVSDLDQIVIDRVLELRSNPDLVWQESHPKCSASGEDFACRARIAEIEKQEEKLIDLYQVGGIDIEMIRKRADSLKEEKDMLLQTLAESKAPAPVLSVRDALDKLDAFAVVAAGDDLNEKRSILRALIKQIVVYPSRVEIHWTFSAQ